MGDNTLQKAPARVLIIRAAVLLIIFLFIFFYGVSVGAYHWPPFYHLQAGKSLLNTKVRRLGTEIFTSPESIYVLRAYRFLYFALDSDGNPKSQSSLPYRTEHLYYFDRKIKTKRTAIVIMDPWENMVSEVLNEHFGKIIKTRILPLVIRAADRGHPIIILTNDPDSGKYNTEINRDLKALVEQHKAVMLFHQNWDNRRFAAFLRSQGIESLIYTGFASNDCLIKRRMGMIFMKKQGFQIFFVPEASAAGEYADTMQDQSIHKAAMMLISQGIAEIIDYDVFMEALAGAKEKGQSADLGYQRSHVIVERGV